MKLENKNPVALTYIFILSIVLLLNGCIKESTLNPEGVDWTQLKSGIVQKDKDIVKTEISKLLLESYPAPTDSDEIGQLKNFEVLVDSLNNAHQLNAVVLCYACIKTLPAQSEIVVTTDSAGIQVHRILDIITPDKSKLKFSSIHDAY